MIDKYFTNETPINCNFQEPFAIFSLWLDEAKQNKQIIEPTAMCLATSIDNIVSSRMVLLKKFDESGFCFFTNFNSNKGEQIFKNSNVALCFYWGAIGRQVRIEGKAIEVSSVEADDYFATRRRESRIGAWASKQSSIMKKWQEFLDAISFFTKKFENSDVPRPQNWSGFRVVPNKIEFWQEGDFRIHQRVVFEKSNEASKIQWIVNKLYP